jgi:hypothetical protein
VAICYFRAGYDPSHFTSEKDWEVRKTLELSYAIKVKRRKKRNRMTSHLSVSFCRLRLCRIIYWEVRRCNRCLLSLVYWKSKRRDKRERERERQRKTYWGLFFFLPSRFFPGDTESVSMLRGCFAGLYSLDPRGGKEVEEIISRAIAHPQHYVLKPDREGGGEREREGGRERRRERKKERKGRERRPTERGR